ncbi:autotransporter outer membrane beta-barrel domain-containing protein [Rickettsia bellii]
MIKREGDLRTLILKLRGLQEQGQNQVQLQAQNQNQGENRRQDQEQTGSSESFKEAEAEELDKEEKAKEEFIILEAQHVDEARIEALEVATMQVAVKEDEKVVATIFNSTQDIYTVSKGTVSSRINSFTGVAAGDEDERVLDKGFWISGTYGISKQGTQKGFIGYRGHTSGGTIGFDIGSDNDKDLVGIAYTRIDSKFKSNGGKLNTNVDSHIVALYGQKELPKNFMIQGMFAYNHNIVKSKINRLGTIANGKYKNNNYNFESLLSYNYLISNKVSFTPNIGIRYGYIKDGTYQESGAGIQHLSIASKKQNIWSSIVGGNVSLAPQKIGAVSITPTIMASVENYFNNKNKKLAAKIKWKDREVTEIVALPKQPKIGYNIGANILAEKGNISVLVEYNCHLQKKYKSHQGFVKLKVKL